MKKFLFGIIFLTLTSCSTLSDISAEIKKNPGIMAAAFQESIYLIIREESPEKRSLLAADIIELTDKARSWYDAFLPSQTMTANLIDEFIAKEFEGKYLRPSKRLLIDSIAKRLKDTAVNAVASGEIPEGSLFTLDFVITNAKVAAGEFIR